MTDAGTSSPGWRPDRDVLEPEWGDEYLPISRAAAKRLVIEAVRQAGQPGPNQTTETDMSVRPDQHVTHAQLDELLGQYVTEAALNRRLHQRDRRIQAVEGNINLLGVVMSAVTDMVRTLGDATNAISDKVTADHALLESVRQQLADALAGNPQAQADLDAAMAGMSATATTLQNLAASPSEPVPPSDPIVGTNGDTTAGEPGTEPPTPV